MNHAGMFLNFSFTAIVAPQSVMPCLPLLLRDCQCAGQLPSKSSVANEKTRTFEWRKRFVRQDEEVKVEMMMSQGASNHRYKPMIQTWTWIAPSLRMRRS